MKKTICSIFLLFSCCWLAAQCPTNDITLSTQGQVDSFPLHYPGCSEMEASLLIVGGDIVRLDSLYPLKKIGGRFLISKTSLTDLTGLNQLDTLFWWMAISDNRRLTSLQGLGNLKTVLRNLEIDQNDSLVTLSGLENLQTLGGCLWVGQNRVLQNLDALKNLQTIGKSPVNQGGDAYHLIIYENYQLENLNALGQATFVDTAQIRIFKNYRLDVCNNSLICAFLARGGEAEITDNYFGCNNVAEVEAACDISSAHEFIQKNLPSESFPTRLMG